MSDKNGRFKIDSIRTAIGAVIINVRMSSPNNNFDGDGPRIKDGPRGAMGWLSDVSVKRKLRNIIMWNLPVWQDIAQTMSLDLERFHILEDPDRVHGEIIELIKQDPEIFRGKYWDARMFGNTFLHDELNGRHVQTGAVHFEMGFSVAPVEIVRGTCSRMAPTPGGEENDKTRGTAPDRVNVVNHGVYVIPFRIYADLADRTSCQLQDVEVFLRLLPHIYNSQPSTVRTSIDVVSIPYIEFKSRLGSGVIDIMESLKPVKEDPDVPSESLEEYTFVDIENNPVIARYNEHIHRKMDLLKIIVGW